MAPEREAEIAFVMLVHEDPVQVDRLARALGEADIYVHCDARTSVATFSEMQERLRDVGRVRWLRRRPTPWAGWRVIDAELAGLSRACAETTASHVAVLSGSDYPLVAPSTMRKVMSDRIRSSLFDVMPMPVKYWRGGGFGRLRYYHAPIGKHMFRFPVPRQLPAGLRPAGGPAMKVLCRAHAMAITSVLADRDDIRQFFRFAWTPDETLLPSIINSEELIPPQTGEVVHEQRWFMEWDAAGRSPVWLTQSSVQQLEAARCGSDGMGALFARKVSTRSSSQLLDLIDERFLREPEEQAVVPPRRST